MGRVLAALLLGSQFPGISWKMQMLGIPWKLLSHLPSLPWEESLQHSSLETGFLITFLFYLKLLLYGGSFLYKFSGSMMKTRILGSLLKLLLILGTGWKWSLNHNVFSIFASTGQCLDCIRSFDYV